MKREFILVLGCFFLFATNNINAQNKFEIIPQFNPIKKHKPFFLKNPLLYSLESSNQISKIKEDSYLIPNAEIIDSTDKFIYYKLLLDGMVSVAPLKNFTDKLKTDSRNQFYKKDKFW